MTKQFILKIIETDLSVSSCEGVGGNETGERWIQPISDQK